MTIANAILQRIQQAAAGGAVGRFSSPSLIVEAFDAGNVSSSSDYNAFPAIIQLAADSYLACYRKGDTHTSQDGVLQILSSTDAYTWTALSTVAADGGLDTREANFVVLPAGHPNAGDVMLFYAENAAGTVTGRYRLSDDDGATWGTEETVSLTGYDWVWLWGNATNIGDTVYFTAYAKNTASTKTNSLLVSWDGTTWAVVGIIGTGAATEYNETAAWTTDGGTNWVALVRDTGLNLRKAVSSNSGATWTLESIAFCPGVSPKQIELADGSRVLGYGRRTYPSVSPTLGGFIEFRRSSDDGLSWTHPVQVFDNLGSVDMGYPAFVEYGSRIRGLFYAYYSGGTGALYIFDFAKSLFGAGYEVDFEALDTGSVTVSGIAAEVDLTTENVTVVSSPTADAGSRSIRVNDVGGQIIGFGKLLNGGTTGEVTFTARFASLPNAGMVQLVNGSGTAYFQMIASNSDKTLRWYNGSAYTDLSQDIALDTNYTIRLVWNSTAHTVGVYLNGVSIGTAGRITGVSGPIRAIHFNSGSGGGTGDDYVVGSISQP